VGKFEVADTDVDDNAKRLAGMLSDGDLVVAAGGDGTATIALNGVMSAGVRDGKLGVLGYGNFNDMARMLGMMSFMEIVAAAEGREGKVVEVWGLQCLVNDKHWRWGMGYFTIGLLAEAAAIFDRRKLRRALRRGQGNLIGQLMWAVKWYGKNRRKQFLPKKFLYNGETVEGATDVIVMNDGRMARIMKGKKMFMGKKKFMAGLAGNGEWRSMIWFGIRSVLWRTPVRETSRVMVEFFEEVSVEVQFEGEYKRFDGVRTVEVKKMAAPAKMIMRG